MKQELSHDVTVRPPWNRGLGEETAVRKSAGCVGVRRPPASLSDRKGLPEWV